MLIEVTQEDIDGGYKGWACECPIALALNRAFNTIGSCATLAGLYVTYKGIKKRFPVGIEICNFIREYDSNKPVKPFSFELVESEEVKVYEND